MKSIPISTSPSELFRNVRRIHSPNASTSSSVSHPPPAPPSAKPAPEWFDASRSFPTGRALSFLLLLGILLFPGVALLAAWQWQGPPVQVQVQSTRRGNVFYQGEAVALKLSGPGASRYLIRDYYGNTVEQGLLSGTLLTPAATEPGWYKVYLHGGEQGMPFGDSVGSSMFCILRNDANFPKMPAPGTFGGEGLIDEVTRGVLGYGPQRHKVDNASAADSEIARLDREIGIDQQYYLPFDTYRKRDLLIVFPNGTWDLVGVRKIVEHFKGSVKYWEPRNEPNFSTGATAFVQNELAPFYQLVKSVDSSLKVLAPGAVTVGPPMAGWNDEFFRAGGGRYIDAFSFHAYNCVNGDLGLTRMSLDQVNNWLQKYNLAGLEKWQTEQGFLGPVYGAYQPRLQGRWTMLQMMVYEQYGIPKEHNHYWYDRNGGFWDEPRWVQNEDGTINPVGVLLRVWAEEQAGTRFVSSVDFGNPGNKLFVGSLFQGPGKQMAAFMTSGETRSQLELNVEGASSVKVVSPFGNERTLPVVNGKVTVQVSELPTYVEYAGVLSVTPVNWGANLAVQSGVKAAASGSTVHPIDAGINNSITKVFNGQLDTWYWSQARDARIWESNNPSYPAWFELRFPAATTMDRVVVYAGIPWQWDGSILDYELQVDQGGQWVSLERVQEPVNTLRAYTQTNRTTVDSFYSERCVFTHSFPPVTTGKIRLLVNDVTWGGASNKDLKDAGAQGGEHQLNLREIEVYRSGSSATKNLTPVAASDAASCGRGGSVAIPVLANDSDPDAGPYPLRLVGVSAPLLGRAAISGDQIVYTASPALSGADQFTYTVSDGISSTTGSVSVNVSSTVQAPGPDTHGLYAEYFNNLDFTAPAFTRVDPYVDANWGTNAPDPAVDAGSFSIRWSGKVLAKYTELYTFYTNSDDGIRLWVNGQLLIDHWSPHAAAWDQNTIALTAGQAVALKLEYFQGGGGAQITLQWSSPSQVREVVPFDALTVGAAGPIVAPANKAPVATGDVVWTPMEMPVSVRVLVNDSDADAGPAPLKVSAVGVPFHGSVVQTGNVLVYTPVTGFAGIDSFPYTITDGDKSASATVSVTVAATDSTRLVGLKGEYFGKIDLSVPLVTRLDTVVNYDWGQGSPDPGLPVDGFSVRWSGTVTPRFSERYNFSATSDDGVRVWVNGALIVDNWSDHAPAEVSGGIDLVAGRPASLRMEYYENSGGALAQLRWSSAGETSGIIPSWALSTPSFNTPPVPPPVTSNVPPVAAPDVAATNEGVSVSVGVLANDFDADSGPQPLVLSSVGQPAHGKTSIVGGAVQYAPSAGYFGVDQFAYTISDGAATASSTVSVTVNSTARALNLSAAGLTGLPVGLATGGSRILADGIWELNATGLGAGGAVDALRMESTSLIGDFVAVLRVRSMAGPLSARAGVMLREGVEPNARCVLLAIGPDGLNHLGARVLTGGIYAEAGAAAPDAQATMPEGWLQVQRSGEQVRLAVSSDGVSFRPVGAHTLAGLAASVQIGVCVSSGAPDIAVRATADQWSVTPVAAVVSGPQHGLLGVYFSRTDLVGPVVARVDDNVDFDWGQGSPHPMIPVDRFSVRWTGQIVPPASGAYTLYTQSDDGVRLWLNNQIVINNWNDHAVAENSVVQQWQAGVPVEVKLEYYESGGAAVSRLWWSGPGISKRAVPTAVLRPSLAAYAIGSVSLPTLTSLPDGIRQCVASGAGLSAGMPEQGGFASQPHSGDFQMALRVRSLSGGSAPVVALMLREGVSGGDRFAAVQLAANGSLSVWGRTVFGAASTSSTVSGMLVPPNAWLLVERRGDKVVLAVSTDDAAYTNVGSIELAGLSQLVYPGAFVAAGGGSLPAKALLADPELTPLSSNGLTGEYFSGIALASSRFTRTDPGVDFNWGLGTADPRLSADLFSVRWTGTVKTGDAGLYMFATQSDDGVRLWVNGQLLVNNWTDHPLTENTASISLGANTWVQLRLEYYEKAGSATVRLLWTPPGKAKQVIPAAQLRTP